MSYHPLPDTYSLQDMESRNINPHPEVSFSIPFLSRGQAKPSRVPIDSARRKRLIYSYGIDWLITIVLAAIFFALDGVTGFKRSFSLEDTSLRHTYTLHERVPPFALYMLALVTPFILQILINLVTIQSLWDFHNGTLGLILGLSLTGAITQFTKITVGRPRPDVIARCIPLANSTDPQWGLSTAAICTQTDRYILEDGFRSFPSGHSSLSFAGLGFLSFYIAGKLHLFDGRGHAPKAWLALTPLSAAALVAISRSMDYRHHWQDILVGSLLGLFMAFFAYRQYYPSLGSTMSHKPYSPRIRPEGISDGSTLPIHRDGPRVEPGIPIGNGSGRAPVAYRDSAERMELEPITGTALRSERNDINAAWGDRAPVARSQVEVGIA